MKYESPEIEVTVFDVANAITASGGNGGFNPGPGGIGDGDGM